MMHATRSDKFRSRSLHRHGALLAALGVLLWTGAAAAQTVERPNVKIMLDWTIQGTHAPFFIADKKGYFKEEGVTVQIEPGKGAGNTSNNVASGVYQFGWADVPTMVKFDAQNPGKELTAVYVNFDETPLCVVTKKSRHIKTPADLDGIKMNGSPGSAIYATMPILLKAAHAEHVKINWLNAAPQLAGPMFMRGDSDGLGGFTNSMVPAAIELGAKMEDLDVMRFADFGVDLYGLALIVQKSFAEANPKTVAAVVRALNKGTKDTIADPEAAIAVMKSVDQMIKPDVELIRLKIALGHTVTKNVAEHGLSSVTPERMQKTIDTVVAAESLSTTPKLADVYTDRFLPPVAERMPPAPAKK
jgi:NitT/TauT family transport system substrate-binding protein